MAKFKIERPNQYLGSGNLMNGNQPSYKTQEPVVVEADGIEHFDKCLVLWNSVPKPNREYTIQETVALFAPDEWTSCIKVVE